MNANEAPSNGIQPSVCSTLFCLCDPSRPEGGDREEAQRFLQSFASLLPQLNFASTCYMISGEHPAEHTCLDSLLCEVSSFLEQYRFLQANVRPVHPFSATHADKWISAYLRYLRACKPFHEEGYREQIIARLRIFPIVFLKDAAAVVEAGPFLSFLQESFFLPSILVPCDAIQQVGTLLHGRESPPWVRVYVSDTSAFDPQRILEILHAHEIFDQSLEDDSEPFPEADNLPCMESLILDESGHVRSRMDEDRLLTTMEFVGISYRLNQQGASGWHRLCDRTATRFVRKGMHDKAIKAWRSSARAYPPETVPSSLFLQIGLCYYEKRDLEAAMEQFAAARKADPQSPDIRYYMGRCEFGWRDYIEAADRFQEALDLGLQHPLRREAEYYRGLSHYHLEEYDAALKPLAEAEKSGMPGSPLPFYQGLCLLGKKEPCQALPCFRRALSLGPSSEDLFHVLFYIAYTYKEMEDFARALEACARAEEVEPENYELWNLKGFCHFKQRKHDEAIACFEKAIEIDPSSGIDYANIASNLRDKGDTEGAIVMYQKALSLDPTIQFARESLERLQKSRTT